MWWNLNFIPGVNFPAEELICKSTRQNRVDKLLRPYNVDSAVYSCTLIQLYSCKTVQLYRFTAV